MLNNPKDIIALIETTVTDLVSESKPLINREPLFGYASAEDYLFPQLKYVASEDHLMPTELLPGAESVLAFFLPFKEEVVISNRSGKTPSLAWAEAYDHTNKLINYICEQLEDTFREQGIQSAWLLPTYHFDKEKLMAQWSHRHVAYICGLGTFGNNNLLITSKGCAGRFGTMVIGAALEPSPKPGVVHNCLAQTGCDYCVKNCPVEALTPSVFDRHGCYRQCLENDDFFSTFKSVEVCGKCSTGPCALKGV